ncbi:MAG TPA: hypothetical protein VGM90_32475 [Kofleriaceae bacterium]|jgi:hypothetical protein
MKRFSFISLVPAALLLVTACVSSDQMARRQYDADYQVALANCGNDQTSFQTGYNAGFNNQQMSSSWTSLCVPDARVHTTAAYQDGFVKGANNAPIRVVHTVRAPAPSRSYAPTTTVASSCTFDSDCGGEGFHCRDHECMGNGWTGDKCVWNDDCANDHCFGGTCRE